MIEVISCEWVNNTAGVNAEWLLRVHAKSRVKEGTMLAAAPAPASSAAAVQVPDGGPLRKLGKRLAELLDEDQFAECEALLLAAAPAVSAERVICPTCGSDEPFTGSCGTSDSDTRALCKRAAIAKQSERE